MPELEFAVFMPRRLGARVRLEAPEPEATLHEEADPALPEPASVVEPVEEIVAIEPAPPWRDAPEIDIPAALREEAIRIATQACALAMRTSVANDAAFVSRLVDEALELCGGLEVCAVRLHPQDAASVDAGAAAIESDESVERGNVVVATTAGSLQTSIDERATLLARRGVADA
jgi:hypothetical protein